MVDQEGGGIFVFLFNCGDIGQFQCFVFGNNWCVVDLLQVVKCFIEVDKDLFVLGFDSFGGGQYILVVQCGKNCFW